ncbi:hypothetical protein KP509_1Z108600 [Ceratopteris richardii]|nr:hypothetical protein KP509_1Z108600 [Ceratopteris richardii]
MKRMVAYLPVILVYFSVLTLGRRHPAPTIFKHYAADGQHHVPHTHIPAVVGHPSQLAVDIGVPKFIGTSNTTSEENAITSKAEGETVDIYQSDYAAATTHPPTHP